MSLKSIVAGARRERSDQRHRSVPPTSFEDWEGHLTPSAPGVAPAGIDWTGDPVFNYIWTSLHVPCVTVPAGSGPGGMPLGVQIVSGRTRDREALGWAAWVGAALESG